MTDADALIAALHECIREAEAAKIGPRESAAHFLWSSLTLPVAPQLLEALPWPLEIVFPHVRVAGEVVLGARMRVPEATAAVAEQRERHRARIARWTLRTLLDGVRPQTAHDLTWRALCEAEALLLSMDDESPSVASIEALARHPKSKSRWGGPLAGRMGSRR
jgi:hypothetical protein